MMLSIIIPVYNSEKYLSQCLDSILNQDFEDLEVICVDDGSIDNSLTILQNYALTDSRIKIINQENCGSGKARNTGLKYAQGDYVWFIDSDDFIEDCLNEIYFNIKSNNPDILLLDFQRYYVTNTNNKPQGQFHLDELFNEMNNSDFSVTDKDMKKYVMNYYYAPWFNIFKKDFLNNHNISFPEGIFYEDVFFHIKSYLYAKSISVFPKVVYNYRIANTSSMMHDNTKSFDIIKIIDSVENFLKEDSFYNEFELEFLMLKISQYNYHINLSKNEDFFQMVKRELLPLKNNINKLPNDTKNVFWSIINSNDLIDYLDESNNIKI